MSNPNALTPAERARLFATGAIREIAPSATSKEYAAQYARKLAKQREWRARQRGGRAVMTNAQSGALGGAPMSVFTPAMLREAWKRIKVKGERPYLVALLLGVQDATLAFHIRGREGKPSRAMRLALAEKKAA